MDSGTPPLSLAERVFASLILLRAPSESISSPALFSTSGTTSLSSSFFLLLALLLVAAPFLTSLLSASGAGIGLAFKRLSLGFLLAFLLLVASSVSFSLTSLLFSILAPSVSSLPSASTSLTKTTSSTVSDKVWFLFLFLVAFRFLLSYLTTSESLFVRFRILFSGSDVIVMAGSKDLLSTDKESCSLLTNFTNV